MMRFLFIFPSLVMPEISAAAEVDPVNIISKKS
jgi:hypothetical protein